jgi:hypothetical protein
MLALNSKSPRETVNGVVQLPVRCRIQPNKMLASTLRHSSAQLDAGGMSMAGCHRCQWPTEHAHEQLHTRRATETKLYLKQTRRRGSDCE